MTAERSQDGDGLSLKETVVHDGEEFHVSTVRLPSPHGPERNQHYETLASGQKGGEATERYETEEQAIEGHEEICERIEAGDYEREPVAYTLRVGSQGGE